MNFIDDRNKNISKMKLNNNVNKLVLAKTLFKIAGDDDVLMRSVANVILNRFMYECEIDEQITFVKCVTDKSLFACWGDFKSMDNIDLENNVFKKCFRFSNDVLNGIIKDDTLSSIKFHKKSEFPSWATGLKPVHKVSDYLFYNNCD